MVPETSVPTSTWVTGCNWPVAVTLTTRSPRSTVTVL